MTKGLICPPGRNNLLSTLSERDFALIEPHLSCISLARKAVLQEPGKPIENVYFLTSGVGSTVSFTRSKHAIETGLFGCDGVSGVPVILQSGMSSHKTFMQVEGAALVIKVGQLRDLMTESPTLRNHLLRYVQCLMTQMSVTALTNAHSKLETRLARWLLMCHDRVHGNQLKLTHEFLSVMLGVRRAGVTVSTHMLEGRGLIRANRGEIIVLDRKGLELEAEEIYGQAEAEYGRLIGSPQAAGKRKE